MKDLSDRLKSGELSALDTLHAYQWRAIQVNKNQNCIVQFLTDAEEEAKRRDKIPIKGSKKITETHFYMPVNCTL